MFFFLIAVLLPQYQFISTHTVQPHSPNDNQWDFFQFLTSNVIRKLLANLAFLLSSDNV